MIQFAKSCVALGGLEYARCSAGVIAAAMGVGVFAFLAWMYLCGE